jgi:RNA polymerase sigma-70 factor (ECF subfamily)
METSRVLEAGDLKGEEAAAEAERPTHLGEVYEAYAAPLYRYLLTLVGSEQDAEDALQEVFLAVARIGLGRVRNLRPYLFQAARRQAIGLLRKRRRRRETDAEISWIDLEACGPDDSALAIDIDRALRSLPPNQREVIALHLSEGYSFREIAALCGTTKDTAFSRYRLGIAKLRGLLKGDAS